MTDFNLMKWFKVIPVDDDVWPAQERNDERKSEITIYLFSEKNDVKEKEL